MNGPQRKRSIMALPPDLFPMSSRRIEDDSAPHKTVSGSEETREIRVRMEAQARALIWSGTAWLSAAHIATRLGKGLADTSAQLATWETEGRLFSLCRDCEHVWPGYAFNATFAPLAVVGIAIDILGAQGLPDMAAAFFESTSHFLQGQRPRELLVADPARVIALARYLRETRVYAH